MKRSSCRWSIIAAALFVSFRVPIIISASLIVLVAGCGKERRPVLPEGRPSPEPSAPPRYSGASNSATVWPIVARTFPADYRETNWSSVPCSIIETELSPAILVRSTNRYLGLFADLRRHGLGEPTHLAWSTRNGPRSFKNGEALDPAGMEENWIIVWFAGANGWTHWDSPWAIFLQHRPTSLRLDSDGLFLTFGVGAGDIVLLPLYGGYKPPQSGFDPLVAQGLPSKKIKTSEWPASLPRDPLVRLRFWAGATRRFPLHCEEQFSIGPAADSITLRTRFRFYEIEDDWRTKPIKLAPLSPVLALSLMEERLPVGLSAKPFDLEMFTPLGPYFGIPDTDTFDATFAVLQYVNETEMSPQVAANGSPAAARALTQMRKAARQWITQGNAVTNGNAAEEAYWVARSLPYMESTEREELTGLLRQRLTAIERGAGRFGNTPSLTNSVRSSADAGHLIEALWAYAHFSGDWAFIRQRWSDIRTRFHPGQDMSWAGFGRAGVIANGELAAPCAAFARLAYQSGDNDAYAYACFLFTRELIQLSVKQTGSKYLRNNQPIDSMEVMPDNVFLADWTKAEGKWNLDGPKYPAESNARRFARRWAGFKDPDVARFFQDYFGPEVHHDVSLLVESTDRGHIATAEHPSLMLLRSLLVQGWQPDESSAGRDANGASLAVTVVQQLAEAWAMIRVGGAPPRFERLIPPPTKPTPFALGLEREVQSTGAPLIARAARSQATVDNSWTVWPEVTWSGSPWRAPDGGPWSFGHIKLTRSVAPRRVDSWALNWNTRVIAVDP